MSPIESPDIMLASVITIYRVEPNVKGIFHVISTVLLLFMFYVFKMGSKVPVVALTGNSALSGFSDYSYV